MNYKMQISAFFQRTNQRQISGDSADTTLSRRLLKEFCNSKYKGRVVVVSGGWDPVHVGHIRLFKQAKKLGDTLVVIANCDSWLIRKKGKYFMNQEDRAEIIRSFECVDDVFIWESEEDDVSGALEIIKPHIFANGGDRRNIDDIPEGGVCKRLNIEMIFNVGGEKERSSSELLANYESR